VLTKGNEAAHVLKALGLPEATGTVDVWCVYWTDPETRRSPFPSSSKDAKVYVRDLRMLKGGDSGRLSDRVVIPSAPFNNRVRPSPLSSNPMFKPMPNPYTKPLWTYGNMVKAAKHPSYDDDLTEALTEALCSVEDSAVTIRSLASEAEKQTAAFSIEQKEALRRHILPLFEQYPEVFKEGSVGWYSVWPLFLKEEKGPDGKTKVYPAADALQDYFNCLVVFWNFTRAVVDTKRLSPARRARIIKDILHSISGRAFINKEMKNHWASLPSVALRTSRKLKAEGLTPLGIEIASLIRAPYMRLLLKSWPYIVTEANSEFRSIFKQFGLRKLSTNEDVLKADALSILQGWKEGDSSSKLANSFGWRTSNKDGFVLISPDDTKALYFQVARPPRTAGDAYCRVTPKFQFGGKVYSWEQYGVDDGSEAFEPATDNLDFVIEVCLKKIDNAIAEMEKLAAEGQTYDFGPAKKTMLPSAYQDVIDRLRANKTWTINPQGFGIAYVFTANKAQAQKMYRFEVASDQLSKDVGRTVFYWRVERD